MRNLAMVLVVSCLASSGCAICASPYDEHYAAFGGRWQRDVENHGRVGSAFTESGYLVEDEPLDSIDGDPGIDRQVRAISYEMPYDEQLSGVDETELPPTALEPIAATGEPRSEADEDQAFAEDDAPPKPTS